MPACSMGECEHQQPLGIKWPQPEAFSMDSIIMTTPGRNDEGGTCVIAVGTTGTGKSSTISICTGQPVRSGSGPNSITEQCQMFTSRETKGIDDLGGGVAWVDTPGWDDVYNDNVEAFQRLLQFLNRQNLTSVRAILWAVHPSQIRLDSSILRQADFINQFAPEVIWDNVIIICKQAVNPNSEAQGAVEAANATFAMARPQVVGYRYLDDVSLDEGQRVLFESNPELRKTLNVLDRREVKELLLSKIQNIEKNVQIIFRKFKCVNCGAVGDKRLLPQFCHMEKILSHPEHPVSLHPLGNEFYHPSNHFVYEHPGELKNSFGGGGSGCFGSREKRFTCCRKPVNGRGCQEKWACCKCPTEEAGCRKRMVCCKQDLENATEGCKIVYNCCKGNMDSQGCRGVCRRCGTQWGKEAKQCFKIAHEVVEISEDL